MVVAVQEDDERALLEAENDLESHVVHVPTALRVQACLRRRSERDHDRHGHLVRHSGALRPDQTLAE